MMAKTTKATKKPMRKATSKLPAALKAMESMVIATADLDVHLKQMTERLNAAGISADLGSIVLAGRFSDGSGWVQVNISSGGFASTWPEWAFGVAEGALHFNKKVFVVYNNQPFGNNLLQALCTNTPA
jgi:hypothetical protein